MVGIKVQADRPFKGGSAPSFRFWQMEKELDIISLLPSQDPDTDCLFYRFFGFKAVKCLIEQLQTGSMGDLDWTGDDHVLSFLGFHYRKNSDLPGPVFHAEQMAELVSVLLVVLSAQIHHPVAASYEHLFPLLVAGKIVFFQMVLGVEKLFCAETEADVSVFQIFRPSFQFCFQPADQLAKMPQLLLLPAVLKEFIGIQPVGCMVLCQV